MTKKLFALLLTAFLFQAPGSSADVDDIVFIVNAKNTVNEISASTLRDFYFKRKRQWPDGESVRFLDRSTGSSVRNVFLKDVLKKTNSDVDLFWIGQKLYRGDSAPLRESSDSTTEQFVASFAGAIGYVSTSTILNSKNVKVVKIKDE